MPVEAVPPIPGRLRWGCRRGLLELDLVLQRFLAEEYVALDECGQDAFARLLACPDPVLLAFIGGAALPEDAALAQIVERLRSHGR